MRPQRTFVLTLTLTSQKLTKQKPERKKKIPLISPQDNYRRSSFPFRDLDQRQ